MNETQTNLLKYYKFVAKCMKCERTFGSDFKKKRMFCPLCTGRNRQKDAGIVERIFMRYEPKEEK